MRKDMRKDMGKDMGKARLRKETVRVLTGGSLRGAVGGTSTTTTQQEQQQPDPPAVELPWETGLDARGH